ncbi:MAG: sulfite oxidase-like oxidoreductase [Chloroflexota bacterium]
MFFNKKKRDQDAAQYQDRLPPGQSVTFKWPVLHVGSTPRFNPQSWDFNLWGLVKERKRFTWDEFSALPTVEQVSDMHCVTQWSKFDSRFEGIPMAEVLKYVEILPEATHVMIHADPSYTTNLPLEALMDDDVMFVTKYEGEPLTPDHGYPVRLLVPKLYLWKSAKWVRGMEFIPADKPGFWEQYGYHNYGDPWEEQRYGGFEVTKMQNVRSGKK